MVSHPHVTSGPGQTLETGAAVGMAACVLTVKRLQFTLFQQRTTSDIFPERNKSITFAASAHAVILRILK
jgi:hypothetical protein